MTRVAALAGGLSFGLGLTVSGMTNPEVVLAFLTLNANWNPTLIAVLVSAVLVTAAGYRLVARRGAPLFDRTFHTPAAKAIDTRLLAGAGLFGVGWGIAGYCPGPALVGAFTLDPRALTFCAGMLLGAWGFQRMDLRGALAPSAEGGSD